MPDSSADRDPLERLAEEFVARYRAGERQTVSEYADRLPDRADEIRELFPALVELEQLKPAPADDLTSPHTDAPAPPLERLGEFRILREVGRGGMGVVYEAVQDPLGRHVALKVLPAGSLADARRLDRFRREARAAAALHHTNIVPVFGTGEASGQHYYAMQFIGGQGLDAVIDELKRLRAGAAPAEVSLVARGVATGSLTTHTPPLADAATHTYDPAVADPTRTYDPIPCEPPDPQPAPAPLSSTSLAGDGWEYWRGVSRLAAQVADALAYAHGQGIVHRDIKPANLLLDAGGIVWVTDFGLAKGSEDADLTETGDIVGTLRYMAPERFENQGDHRVDIYALGLTLYELLTLKPAFSGDTKPKLIEQVVAANPARPRTVNSSIPRDLETVVLKAIACDPAMRYQSASEFATDLQRFIEDRPVLARRASAVEQAWRWCRRNPAVASLLAAVLLSLAVGAAVSVGFALQSLRNEDAALTAKGESDTNATLAKQNADVANTNFGLAKQHERNALSEADLARHLTYLARMGRAGDAMRSGNYEQVRTILAQITPTPGQPDYRGWEWYYLNNLINGRSSRYPVPATLARNHGLDPVLSPDGRFAAWRQHASEERKPADGEPPPRRAVLTIVDLSSPDKVAWGRTEDFSPSDGQHGAAVVAVSGAAGRVVWVTGSVVRILELTTGTEVRKWRLAGVAFGQLTLDPSGRYAAINIGLPKKPSKQVPKDDEDDDIWPFDLVTEIWDTTTAIRVARVQLKPKEWLGPPVFSPDGKRLAAGTLRAYTTNSGVGGLIRWAGVGVWDVATGKLISHGENPFSGGGRRGFVDGFDGGDEKPGPMCFAADGKTLFVAPASGIEVRDVASGKTLFPLPDLDGPVTTLALSPDGKTLAAGEKSGAIVLIDPNREAPNERVYGQTGAVQALAFRADAPALVSAAADPVAPNHWAIRRHDIGRRGYHLRARIERVHLDEHSQVFNPGSGPENDPDRAPEKKTYRSPDGRYEGHREQSMELFAVNPATQAKVRLLRVLENQMEAVDWVWENLFPVFFRDSLHRSWEAYSEFVVTEVATKRRLVLQVPQGEREWMEELRFTPDGRGFLGMISTPVGDGPRWDRLERRMVLWNLETGKPERETPVPKPLVAAEPRRQHESFPSFTPDCSKIVWLVPPALKPATPDRVQTAAEAVLAPAELHVWDVSPFGEFSGHTSHTIDWLGDPTSEVATTDAAESIHVEIPPDTFSDRWLVVANQRHAQVFDLQARKLLPVCRTRGWSTGMALADDGSRLFHFVGDELRVYDLRTGEEVASLPPPIPARYRKEDQPLRYEAGRLVFAGYKGYRPTPEEARIIEKRLDDDEMPLKGVNGRSVLFDYVLVGTRPKE